MWGQEHQLDTTDPAVMTLHGTEDDRAVYTLALDLDRRCKEIGHDCVLVPFEGAGHLPWGSTYDGKSIWALSFEFCVNRLQPPDH